MQLYYKYIYNLYFLSFRLGDVNRRLTADKPSPTESPKVVVPISINVTPAAQFANDNAKPVR